MNVENPPRIISLFSGCGGMDLGFIGALNTLKKILRTHRI
jgi:site-specific DNA-cytosine methylase